MSGKLIQYAFVAGEISPSLFGRTDFEKYDLGLAQAQNWFLDYRGGISTRPGTEFIDYIQHDHLPVRLFKFEFSPDIANTYSVLFGQDYVRFIQDGGYVLEAGVAITAATQATPTLVTAAGHGFADGDWVKITGVVGMTQLNTRTFEVTNKTTDTFELVDPFGDNVNSTGYGAYVSGGTVSRIYTVTSPYNVFDLAALQAYQIRDTLRLTHPEYKVRNLVRVDTTNWTLGLETFGSGVASPTGLGTSASGAGSAGTIFAVTAVDLEGNESQISEYAFEDAMVDYSTTAGYGTVTWTSVFAAAYYNVYRSIIVSNSNQLQRGMQLGFLGRAFGTQFTDNNIVPDFATTPPQFEDPFADGKVVKVSITASGSGYDNTTTMTVTGGSGSGFVGYPIVNAAGQIIGVIVVNGGSGYTGSPVVAFTVGTGATAVATLGALSGNNPSTSGTFQQRQIYAATENDPLRIFGSQVGLFSNMDTSFNVTDSDAWDYTVDSRSVTPIRYMLEMRGGLLVFAHTTVWQLRGGANGEPLTALNALAEPQSYLGIADLPPLNIDTDILYNTAKDSTVRLLAFNDFSKLYAGKDVSILSSHFFGPTKRLIEWDYSAAPHKIAYGIREDGILLSFTIVPEQNVDAWTWNSTDGKFKNLVTVEEDGLDRTYFVVERTCAGSTRKYLERMASREFTTVEDAWCLDTALSLGATYPAGTIFADAATGLDVLFTVNVATPFLPTDVDKIIRFGGGKAVIKTFVDTQNVRCNILRDFTDINYESGTVHTSISGNWTMDAEVSTLTGFWHLEGHVIKVLGDGNVIENLTVVNGQVTLPNAVSRAIGGIPYTCISKTLPPTASDAVIEDARKLLIGAGVRIQNTVGLKTGRSLDKLYPMKLRTTELPGEPTRLQDGSKFELGSAVWDIDATTYFVQDNPLPATVLNFVHELEVGDDTN